MKPIFEISKGYIELLEQIEANGGEITTEIETALAISESQLKEKSKSYAYIIKSLEAETEIASAEIKRLTEAKRQRERAIEQLENRLKNAMLTFGVDKIEHETIKISLRKSNAINVTDIQAIPDQAKIIKVEASKTVLKELFKNGVEVNGAEQIENINLNIK